MQREDPISIRVTQGIKSIQNKYHTTLYLYIAKNLYIVINVFMTTILHIKFSRFYKIQGMHVFPFVFLGQYTKMKIKLSCENIINISCSM